jgi:hypothetical protein
LYEPSEGFDSAVGVFHRKDEESTSRMACANFERLKQSDFRSVANCFQSLVDFWVAVVEVLGDVLEEADGWSNKSNKVCDGWPEVARVVLTSLLACNGEWLARVAANDAIHDSTPRAAVEGVQI